MAAVIETLEGLDGKITNKDMIGENGEFNKKSKTYVYAEKVFKLMDNDRDGEINVDEFVKGYQKLKSRQVLLSAIETRFWYRFPKNKVKYQYRA